LSWIRISAPLLVAAVVALQPNMAAAERCLGPPCPPLTGQALFADACAMLLSSRASGYRDPKEDEWLPNCAKAGSLCRETKDYIEKATRRPAADLVCQAGGEEAVRDKKRGPSVDEVARIPVGPLSRLSRPERKGIYGGLRQASRTGNVPCNQKIH
jgi:hypothetical protein